MDNYFITTDATCDLQQDYAEQFVIIPMAVTMDGTTYDKGITDNKDFYARMRAGSMPTTSLVSPETTKPYFEKILKNGYDILHIGFSSALSGTCQSAFIAASELLEQYPERKITVVDSKAASLGEGLLVDYALTARAEGKSYEECCTYISELAPDIVQYFTVDDLMHLHRGGRVSKGTAIVGQILKIKPLLHTDKEGRLIPLKKIFTRKLALKGLVDKLGEQVDKTRAKFVFIGHGDSEEDARFVAELIEKEYGIPAKRISHIGAIVGAHSGPGTIALFFIGKRES